MAAFVLLFVNDRALRRERIFRDRINPLDRYTDLDLVARYRFPRREILLLTDLVNDTVQHPTSRSCAIPVYIQVLITLRFLAKGDYLSEVADLHGVSVPSSSRILHSVCLALCQQLNNITFPSTPEEQKRVKDGFYKIAHFPNVVGAIDGTLIPIQGMSGDDEPHFICRKGFPSINVQGVVDADLRFTNAVVKWPGSTHDSFILTNSSVPQLMETLNGPWILGDSGYPLKKWLLTPFNEPSGTKEENYNQAHCSTRNTVERAFGVLKCRFRCLHKTGGSLQFTAPKCSKMIECCLRLHNMAINRRLPLEAADDPIQILHNNTVYRGNGNDGFRVRQTIAQRF
nr:putative nuclease HARBI1 [Crassostrea gigas]